jgi:hypothetical protein
MGCGASRLTQDAKGDENGMLFSCPPDPVSVNDRRVEELRRQLYPVRATIGDRHRVRRWIGLKLVRLGVRLATDPPLRPVQSL